MIKFLYKFGIISIFSFILSNLLFYIFEKFLNPSVASFITISIILNINILLLFKTKLFSKNKKNYIKLLYISISFRIFEYLLFNLLYYLILTNLKSNFIFLISLVASYLIKSIIYYKAYINDKN